MDSFISDFQKELSLLAIRVINQYFTSLLLFAGILGTLELLKRIAKDSIPLNIIIRLFELFVILYMILLTINKLELLKFSF